MHLEGEALAPHRVECVAVDGLSAEVASVSRQAKYLHLYARAAVAVPWTHVLPGHHLINEEGQQKINKNPKYCYRTLLWMTR